MLSYVDEISLQEIYEGYIERFKLACSYFNPDAKTCVTPLISCFFKTVSRREFDLRKSINLIPNATLPMSEVSNSYEKGNSTFGATKGDLDCIASLFGLKRKIIDEGDSNATPPIPRKLESDSSLVQRIYEAPRKISQSGTGNWYSSNLLSVASSLLKEVNVSSPKEGELLIRILPNMTELMQNGTKLIETMGQWYPDSPTPNMPLNLPFYTMHWFDGRFDINAPSETESYSGIKWNIERELLKIKCATEKIAVEAPKDIYSYRIEVQFQLNDSAISSEIEDEIMKVLVQYAIKSYKIGGSFSSLQIYSLIDRPEVMNIKLIEPSENFFEEFHGNQTFRENSAVCCKFAIKDDLIEFDIKVNGNKHKAQKTNGLLY